MYDDITKMQLIDLNFWLHGDILLKVDKMSMANSLEVRVPFLDREVYALARTLCTNSRVNREATKFAFRRAAATSLPPNVASKKKLGFPVPIRVWLREWEHYKKIQAAFTSETAAEYFHTHLLIRLLDEHKAGKRDNSRKIWTVYCFLVWHKVYFGDEKEINFN